MAIELEIRSKLPGLPKELRKRAAVALNRAAESHQELAKIFAPLELRDSISVGKRASATDLRSETMVNHPLALETELGSTVSPAQPFFSPSYEIAKQDLTKELKDVFK